MRTESSTAWTKRFERGDAAISLSSQDAASAFPAHSPTEDKDLRAFVEAIPIMAWASNANGSVSYFNRLGRDFTGLEHGAGLQGWMEALHPDDLPGMAAHWKESLLARVGGECEYRIWSSVHSCFRWQLLRWQAIERDGARDCSWVGVSIDIHDRKTLEERFEAAVSGRIVDMQRSLAQKETLLQEVHHRVRNNLQIIASLLAMQMASLKDDALVTILRESERRISSMVMIHQWLYQSARVEELDFSDYAGNLVRELISIYGGQSNRLVGSVKSERVMLGVDQAIPCGLILNELVTNALKYAYPGGESGEVSVDIQKTKDRVVVVTVRDQGVGLPEGFAIDEARSFGLTLVQELTRQLDGELIIDGRGGASFTLQFPKT